MWLVGLTGGLSACGKAQVANADTAASVGETQSVGETDDAPSDTPTATGPLLFPALDPTRCTATDTFQTLGFDRQSPRWASGDHLQDRLSYLLTVLQQQPARGLLEADGQLAALAKEKREALAGALGACQSDLKCLGNKIRWLDADIAAFQARLVAVLASPGGTGLGVLPHVRACGAFALHAGQTDDVLLATAASEALSTVRKVFDARVAGQADLPNMITQEVAAHPASALAFEPMLHLALAGLRRAKRDQAAAYEPLVTGPNAAAVARMAKVTWSQWRFALIVVPGEGPTDLTTLLTENGQNRCDLAFERWQAGVAPFILLSGGHVHPDGTPYAEAIEMKKYLLKRGVPEDALLVDPYARHTTTNLRNAAREMLRYGVPPDRPVLVTSDLFQSAYITFIGPRCQDELGYKPFRLLVKLGENDSCWLPDARALYEDARDERDP